MSDTRKQPPKAAFEVKKGTCRVMTLSEVDVEKYLDLRELLAGLEDGFCGLELGEVQCPPRPRLSIPGRGFSLAMPAWRPGMQVTVKIVNVFDRNLETELPNHLALINLFDPETGIATCVMDGTYITGIRTAASAILSARMLSRRESRIATVIGAGVQGREHLRMLPLIRNLERIHICSLRFEEAQSLAAQSEIACATADVEAAVRESDIVCLATHSPAPVIRSEWAKPGTHVSSVGYNPPYGELPKDLASKHRLFVETLDAFQPPPVGCGELAGLDASMGTTLGAVALGRKPGRVSDSEITVYKAMGTAMEDMVAANLAYQKASREGGGGVMVW
ncbi:MAG TPA: ornithine cyclodeaminase family protein [Candidatus Acidoferrales bacterium]|jgi:ornithine cyclodeaminase/alanine dehydrogenase-like protein (mu-crystallin family)|nr:ornithine cyclodeaminase family protein [Candidatus Acidoferrales bacterium]